MKSKVSFIKNVLIYLFILFYAMPLIAEVSVSSEATAYYSFGFATEEQMVPSTQDGVYDEKKNGFYIDGSISLKGAVEGKVDLSMELSTKSMSGSPYLDLQLSPSSPSDFEIKLDHVYSRFHMTEWLFRGIEIGRADLEVNLIAGKFGLAATEHNFSRFSLDSSMAKVKMGSSPALDLETVLFFPGAEQFYYGEKSSLTLNLAAGGLLGEDIQRLFDTDGGISQHGNEVLGEYAPHFFADLALNRYVLPFGTVSASASYAYNGSGFYTGHSAGVSLMVDTALIPEKLFLPVSVSGAFYEKNTDALGSATDNSLDVDTTDFRSTFRIGFAVGARYVPRSVGIAGPPKYGADLTVSGSYTGVGHIYRDTLSLLSLAVDGQYYITPKIYLGGGFILGTVGDVTWKTSSSVSTALDDYSHTFAKGDNFGYEAFVGLDFLGFGKLAVGFAHKKGLSMNYGIETVQSGMIKFRQSGSTLAEELWETRGLFVKATVEF